MIVDNTGDLNAMSPNGATPLQMARTYATEFEREYPRETAAYRKIFVSNLEAAGAK